MTKLSHFERLVESVDLIARHVDYPGKQEVVNRCAEEIEELFRAGQINDSQEGFLLQILRNDCRRQSA